MTSLFTTTWLCPKCGREICGDCHATLSAVFEEYQEKRKTDPEFASASYKLKATFYRERQSFYAAICHIKQNIFHSPAQFIPITYFDTDELQTAIAEMRLQVDADLSNAEVSPVALVLPDHYIHQNPFPDPTGIPSHPMPWFSVQDLSENTFRTIWAHGTPILVDDLGPLISSKWTPEGLTAAYGEETCTIMNCDTEKTEEITVAEFFDLFGAFESEKRNGCWKLKVRLSPS